MMNQCRLMMTNGDFIDLCFTEVFFKMYRNFKGLFELKAIQSMHIGREWPK